MKRCLSEQMVCLITPDMRSLRLELIFLTAIVILYRKIVSMSKGASLVASEYVLRARGATIYLTVLLLVSACGGQTEEPRQQFSLPSIGWTNYASSEPSDIAPPKLVFTIVEAVESPIAIGMGSVTAIVIADEELRSDSLGRPSATVSVDGHESDGTKGSFAFIDNSKSMIKLSLDVRLNSSYVLRYSIPDRFGNQAIGTLAFNAGTARPTQTLPITNTKVVTSDPTLVSNDVYWIQYGYTSTPSYGLNSFAYTNAPNTTGLPTFFPPLVLERTRGPNYTWVFSYRYQTSCPEGNYCPPVEAVAPPLPSLPPPNLTGIAGSLIKLCWYLDCGSLILEEGIDDVTKQLLRALVKG